MASWHLWVACQICQYLSVGDLLNYVRAVRPGGIADKIYDKIIPKKQVIDNICNNIIQLPVIGKPTKLMTNILVDYVMSPIIKKVSNKLIPETDQVLLWSLATVRCARLIMNNDKEEEVDEENTIPTTRRTIDDIQEKANQNEENALINDSKTVENDKSIVVHTDRYGNYEKGSQKTSKTSNILHYNYHAWDLASNNLKTPAMHYAEERMVHVIKELREV